MYRVKVRGIDMRGRLGYQSSPFFPNPSQALSAFYLEVKRAKGDKRGIYLEELRGANSEVASLSEDELLMKAMCQ